VLGGDRARLRGSACAREAGAAVAEFAMLSVLVALLAMAVLQLGLALYVRNVLVACASEGARLGARADASPRDGAARTRELITASLSPRFARKVSVEIVDTGPTRVVEVRVTAPLPIAGTFGPEGGLSAVGRAFLERQ
jgi:Flp pilus assembly protein TadG